MPLSEPTMDILRALADMRSDDLVFSDDTAVPVIFPPGRARLATSPLSTGSFAAGTTMGIVVVASRAASVVPGTATMRFTLSATNSAARSGRSSRFQAADRYSMMRFWPTT